jgi:methylated-DNA-protein-cysteine methyltransferase-like protein
MTTSALLSARQQKMLSAIRVIPKGRVASYGQIAYRAGFPGCARQVGQVLRDCSEEHSIPWHRVVRANGKLAFLDASEAFLEQCRRLKKEGVEVIHGRVPMKYFSVVLDLDAELWGMP